MVDGEENDGTVKEVLLLTSVTSVTSDQSVSEPLSCNHDNLITSNYHNIASLRVPIAEAESDFETPDNDDDDDDDDDDELDEKDDDEEEEEKQSRVNTFFSPVCCCSISLKLSCV